MRVYTKFGDGGKTQLIGGVVVSKGDARVRAYGAVDELNSSLGVVTAFSGGDHISGTDNELIKNIQEVQSDLFIIGAELATVVGKQAGVSLDPSKVKILESQIDKMEDSMPALTNFILPGGSRQASLLHNSRSVCRRAEREIVTLMQSAETPINKDIVIYMNRLGDWLFTYARFVNFQAKIGEIIWKNPK